MADDVIVLEEKCPATFSIGGDEFTVDVFASLRALEEIDKTCEGVNHTAAVINYLTECSGKAANEYQATHFYDAICGRYAAASADLKKKHGLLPTVPSDSTD
jgi:hypothetical protein|tara:strand:- start:918 stop:1223 length:306 start_codon:yes stop_codon:yes gene_type:complete